MRSLFFLVYCLVCFFADSIPGHAQNSARDRLRAQAAEMSTAFSKRQYEKIIELMYPKIVEAAGGREQMVNVLKSGMNKMAMDGFKFDAIEIGQPTVPVAGGSQLFAVVPQSVQMTGPKMKIESTAFLLAISDDQGKSWSFLDGSGLTPAAVSQMFPNFPATLKLPDKKEPKVTRQP